LKEEQAIRRNGSDAHESQWARFGFLFADLFTALAMLFLIANTAGQAIGPKPSATPTPAATPACALAQTPAPSIVVSLSRAEATGLRATPPDPSAVAQFQAQVAKALAIYSNRTIGLAQVYGGSYNGTGDVDKGVGLAKGAIIVLKLLGASDTSFLPNKTLFQPFWNGDLTGDQVMLTFFFYLTSGGANC
jgi:hypothetical protein